MRNSFVGLLILLLILNGCAGLDVEYVADDNTARGIRYYQSAPFLLVHTDNEGGLSSSVIYLPDLKKKFSIKPYNYLASNKLTLTFANGTLSKATNTADATAVPKAVVASLETVAQAAIAAMNLREPKDEEKVPSPYLFRIFQDTNGDWKLLGGPGMSGGKILQIDTKVSKPAE